ncbi:30S ribosomal protein S17, chloroplastic-like [Actinidia eriantha]|uniref:30S ribosomal protein S17, chloroplastic-like n=1 Tax=Actinidia eriantha TaxID=165200 RepID=UPI00258B17FD|nr:30S ribosomal protein S17, chloroplastic-like [Actinidia eriantha]
MSITLSFLPFPLSQLQSLTFNGRSLPSLLRKPTTFSLIWAMKSLQGRVVCTTTTKTVSIEVTHLAPHQKYKCQVRKKKKFQAHDLDNQFKVGDYVQLEKSRPISKTKAFIAVPMPPRNVRKTLEAVLEDLGLPVVYDLPMYRTVEVHKRPEGLEDRTNPTSLGQVGSVLPYS